MAENSILWNTNGVGDGAASGISREQWQTLITKLLNTINANDCVIAYSDTDPLAPSVASQTISIEPGYAVCNGMIYFNTAQIDFEITTPSINTTGGSIILQWLKAQQTIRLGTNVNDDGNIAIPTVTQNADQWEINIATFTITTGGVITLSDARSYIHIGTKTAQLPIRQGAHADFWLNVGATNNYIINQHIEELFGIKAVGNLGAGAVANGSVVFGKEFSTPPLVFLQIYDATGGFDVCALLTASATTGFDYSVLNNDVSGHNNMRLIWRALGPID